MMMMSHFMSEMTLASKLFVYRIFFSLSVNILKEIKKEKKIGSRQRRDKVLVQCHNGIYYLSLWMHTTVGGFLFLPKALTEELQLKAPQAIFLISIGVKHQI